jgi:glutathione S-transferase
VSATLYSVHSSHSAHAARLMLEHKGIEHRVVNLVPGTHAALLRPLGFRHGTVPAMRLHGRRVQGSRAIARALEKAKPEPPLFPADPRERIRVEEAERWGDENLQLVPRRLAGWINVRRQELRAKLVHEAGVPAPHLVASAGWPVAWYFAHKVGANDTAGVRRMVEMLPARIERVDGLLEEGTIGGKQRNAADFQIGTSVRLLMAFEDLVPTMEGRKAARFATELMPDYPTGVPAGLVPQEWLEPLRETRSTPRTL